MISINGRAGEIVRRMAADAEALGLSVIRYPSGATVIDAGVDASGSLEAGRLFSEACMGGLAQASFCQLDFDGLRLPGIQVATAHPPLSCVASQMAGWPVQWEDGDTTHSAMGSGPARALWGVEKILAELGYRDQSDLAVLMLEGDRLPPEKVAIDVARRCSISPRGVYLLVASVASLVGTVQVPARVVESALHKMLALGFDIRGVVSGFGTCPLAPLVRDPLRAIGYANDAVLYGSRCWLTMQTQDELIEAILDKLPSSASADYGTSFYELFQRYGHDFYRMDPLLFSVAEININNVSSGRTFRAGTVSSDLVRRMLVP
jgi:methenyltetrahydromethanopterin cyclohydrolase